MDRYRVIETGHLGNQGTVIGGENLSMEEANKLKDNCNGKASDTWTWYEIEKIKQHEQTK